MPFIVFVSRQKASASDDKTIKLWTLSDGRCVNTLKGHTSYVTALEVVANGVLASASSDETIRLWSLSDGRNMAILSGHSGTVNALAFITTLIYFFQNDLKSLLQ